MSVYPKDKDYYKHVTKSKDYDKVMKESEQAIMLSFNEDLFKEGHITEEMYRRAKEMIVDGKY